MGRFGARTNTERIYMNVYSFWAVNGNDLDELHLGHVALLLQIKKLLLGKPGSLTIVFNERQQYGTRSGLSPKNTRVYKLFFEQFFASQLGITLEVKDGAELATDTACLPFLTELELLYDRLARVVPSGQITPSGTKALVSELSAALDCGPERVALIVEALLPFLAKEGKRAKIFEEMAMHNTAIIAMLGTSQGKDHIIISGERHDYRYKLSNALVAFINRHPPKYKFVSNVPNTYGQEYMTNDSAGAILITATAKDIQEALAKSQRHSGPTLCKALIDIILSSYPILKIGAHDIRESHQLTPDDIDHPSFTYAIAEAVHGALEPFRLARTHANNKSRGSYIEFSSARCMEFLRSHYQMPQRAIPDDVGSEPLKYRDLYFELQDAALNETKKHIPTSKNDVFTKAADLTHESRDIDVLSYFTSKRYRDHHIHVVNVLYAGLVLLQLNMRDGVPLSKHVANTLHWPDMNGAVHAAWTYTALLHDHCYPVSFALNHAPRLNAISTHFGTSATSIFDAVENAIGKILGLRLRKIVTPPLGPNDNPVNNNEIWVLLQRYFPAELANKGFGHTSLELLYDHGALSALNLLDTASILYPPTGKAVTQEKILFEAARAILLHNLESATDTISGNRSAIPLRFTENPLGALLILCDEMQEWGRTCLGPKGYETMISDMLFGPVEGNVLDDESIRCKFEYIHSADKSFYDWNFDVFSHGKAQNLKRLSFSGIPFPKRFEFSVGIQGMSVSLE